MPVLLCFENSGLFFVAARLATWRGSARTPRGRTIYSTAHGRGKRAVCRGVTGWGTSGGERPGGPPGACCMWRIRHTQCPRWTSCLRRVLGVRRVTNGARLDGSPPLRHVAHGGGGRVALHAPRPIVAPSDGGGPPLRHVGRCGAVVVALRHVGRCGGRGGGATLCAPLWRHRSTAVHGGLLRATVAPRRTRWWVVVVAQHGTSHCGAIGRKED